LTIKTISKLKKKKTYLLNWDFFTMCKITTSSVFKSSEDNVTDVNILYKNHFNCMSERNKHCIEDGLVLFKGNDVHVWKHTSMSGGMWNMYNELKLKY